MLKDFFSDNSCIDTITIETVTKPHEGYIYKFLTQTTGITFIERKAENTMNWHLLNDVSAWTRTSDSPEPRVFGTPEEAIEFMSNFGDLPVDNG